MGLHVQYYFEKKEYLDFLTSFILQTQAETLES